jgi:hypothetical protein
MPTPLREDAVIAGGVSGDKGVEGAQEVDDGTRAHGQQRRHEQEGETEEGRMGEGRRKAVQEGTQSGGQLLVVVLQAPACGAGPAGLEAPALTWAGLGLAPVLARGCRTPGGLHESVQVAADTCSSYPEAPALPEGGQKTAEVELRLTLRNAGGLAEKVAAACVVHNQSLRV